MQVTITLVTPLFLWPNLIKYSHACLDLCHLLASSGGSQAPQSPLTLWSYSEHPHRLQPTSRLGLEAPRPQPTRSFHTVSSKIPLLQLYHPHNTPVSLTTANIRTSCAGPDRQFPSVGAGGAAQAQSPRRRTALKRGGHRPLPRVPAFAPPLSFPHQDGGVRPDHEDRALLGPAPGLSAAGVPLCQGGTRMP